MYILALSCLPQLSSLPTISVSVSTVEGVGERKFAAEMSLNIVSARAATSRTFASLLLTRFQVLSSMA